MKGFLYSWFIGYTSPSRAVAALQGKPAPHYGFYAQALRILMDALLLYLPLSLLGRQPSTPSFVTLFPTQTYYSTMIWLQPLFLLIQFFVMCTAAHLILRLTGRRSGIDLIINLIGMSALIVGAFLVVWDWLYVLLGGSSDIFLGISHWIFAQWATAIMVIGFKRYLDVPIWLGIAIYVLLALLTYPFAMLLIRGPV